MKCNLTTDCAGNLQLKPEQDDSIKFYWECDTCHETKIVQRTKQELIALYTKRIHMLEAGIGLDSIYAGEALELLQSFKDEDLKYLPVANELVRKFNTNCGGSK